MEKQKTKNQPNLARKILSNLNLPDYFFSNALEVEPYRVRLRLKKTKLAANKSRNGLAHRLTTGFLALMLMAPLAATAAPDTSGYSGYIVSATNNVRAGKGLEALSSNPTLRASAQAKAEDMATRGYFGHAGPEGHRVAYWLGKYGYKYSIAGENLAMGFYTAADAMQGWIGSATHYANLVEPRYNQIGIGVAVGSYEGRETIFVVQHFGMPQVAPAPQPVATPPQQPASVAPVIPAPAPAPAEASAKPVFDFRTQPTQASSLPRPAAPVAQPAASHLANENLFISTAGVMAAEDIPEFDTKLNPASAQPVTETSNMLGWLTAAYLIALMSPIILVGLWAAYSLWEFNQNANQAREYLLDRAALDFYLHPLAQTA